MRNYLRTSKPCLPEWWTEKILDHARLMLVLVLILSTVLLFFTVKNFKISTDLTRMIKEDLPFRQMVHEYHRQFPDLVAPIVIVIKARTPEGAQNATDLLAEKLTEKKNIFSLVYAPGSGPFWQKYGLLYLSREELEDQGDTLAEMQPFLALLSEDFSLAGLFSVLETIVDNEDFSLTDNPRLLHLFSGLDQTMREVGQGKTGQFSWQQLMAGSSPPERNRRFIIVKPILDYGKANPAKKAVHAIEEISRQLDLDGRFGATISLTGKPVINYQDLKSVRKDITTASLLSLVLVGIILYIGIGSLRLVFASLSTLLIGLAWTISFAILVVGRLNMISVTFVVLFIGLGIDYSIQICLRYKELVFLGHNHRQAIIGAVSGTGNALIICAISTAIGFYAFVPTAYVGASELGLISGTGMFCILLASITVLPAIMFLLPEKEHHLLPLPLGRGVAAFLIDHPRPIVLFGLTAALVSVVLLPRVRFDANPFHMSDQRSEGVRTVMQLFKDTKNPPWSISILEKDPVRTEQLAAQLKSLPEVGRVLTIASFIPKNQEEKLSQLEDMNLMLPPAAMKTDQHDDGNALQALEKLSCALEKKIRRLPEGDPDGAALGSFVRTARQFLKEARSENRGAELVAHLDKALMPGLASLLNRMTEMTRAGSVSRDQLPGELVRRYISKQGVYRIQVFPREDLRDSTNLQSFVSAVLAVAPDATDQPITVYMAGKTIVSAFRTASLLAFVLIALFLRLVMRSWIEVALVLAPLLIALLYTLALAALFAIPFNFANIIIVPLLLGIGVDAGIHVIARVREIRGVNIHILETSTARAVLFSSLTTIMSFGTLSFMHHAGTASMGKLLTISVLAMIFTTLFLLPAYLELRLSGDKGRDNGPVS